MSDHPETNTEFITRVMDFAKSGPLMQAFVIQALTSYSEDVMSASDAQLENPMVHPDAWRRCAVEMQQELENKYGR